eukprot:m.571640 g.571640  ORF g.571640 m.571640 type:complete len:404 (+) comp22268_c0_seq3:202-1413(+)
MPDMSSTDSKQSWLSIGTAVLGGTMAGAFLQWAHSQRHRSSNAECGKPRSCGVGSELSTLHDAKNNTNNSDGRGRKPIYLDWNATTPIFAEVTDAMMPYTKEFFGNPSSKSYFSKPCQMTVQQARDNVATMVGCNPSEIIFTSCGTESDNTAIHLALKACTASSENVPHIVTSATEHPAIEECLLELSLQGRVTVTRVPVDGSGVVSVDDVRAAITTDTVLVTIMHSNNEVGSINPIAAIGALCAAQHVLFHTDAAQSCGKVPVDVAQLRVDMATIVGHKFGAPKGVAALYVRDGCLAEHGRKLPSLYGTSGGFLMGGGQESGRRAGTENVLLIAALGAACKVRSAHCCRNGIYSLCFLETVARFICVSSNRTHVLRTGKNCRTDTLCGYTCNDQSESPAEST